MKPRLARLRPPKNGLLVGKARGLQVKIKMTSDFQDFQLWRIPNLDLGTTDGSVTQTFLLSQISKNCRTEAGETRDAKKIWFSRSGAWTPGEHYAGVQIFEISYFPENPVHKKMPARDQSPQKMIYNLYIGRLD